MYLSNMILLYYMCIFLEWSDCMSEEKGYDMKYEFKETQHDFDYFLYDEETGQFHKI